MIQSSVELLRMLRWGGICVLCWWPFSGVLAKVGLRPVKAAEHAVFGAGNLPERFSSEQDLESFLKTAEVVSRSEIPTGINRPTKLLLEQDGLRMHAILRTVDQRERNYRAHDRLILRFRDAYLHEVAAYRLSRLLGIDSIPVAVLRRDEGRLTSVQAWVEEARTEGERRLSGEPPPRSLEWVRQWQVMRVFDALIDNFDRNIGNLLVDSAWKLWLVDHTRSFTIYRRLYRPERIHLCKREVWDKLRALDKDTVSQQLGDVLTPEQVNAMMKRQTNLVRYLERLIAERGEQRVLF